LLFAIVFVAGYLFVAIAGRSPAGLLRWIFFVYLLAVCGSYFVFCWTRTGQTLAQKTWGVKVVRRDGKPLGMMKAILRYLLAFVGTISTLGLLWAVVDPERQFLHDRLTGTRIIVAVQAGTIADANG